MTQIQKPGRVSAQEGSSSPRSVKESAALSTVQYKPPRRAYSECTVRTCSCSCHRGSGISGRFWALDCIGLLPASLKCDQPLCTASIRGFRLRVALSQLGIPWSVTIGLRTLAGIGSFSIQPALQMERVVKYTSPGFGIIWQWRYRFISTDEACTAFRALAREDPTLHLHVDPSGSSYVEVRNHWNLVSSYVL